MPDHSDLRRLAEQATPGRWEAVCAGNVHWGVRAPTVWANIGGRTVVPSSCGRDGFGYGAAEEDAAFIAAASPDVILDLLDENDRLQWGAYVLHRLWDTEAERDYLAWALFFTAAARQPRGDMTTYRMPDRSLVLDEFSYVGDLDFFDDACVTRPLDLVRETWRLVASEPVTYTPPGWNPEEEDDDA
ncbi:MAG TPA: ead/Ea22-like family protein [Fimbriimonadaceae bacterium]|nr:ead/Ea22-like family protein [Fimbriimonadaceae bacterium]